MKKNLQTLVNQSDVKSRHAVLCARLAAFGDMLKNEAEHGFEGRDINWASDQVRKIREFREEIIGLIGADSYKNLFRKNKFHLTDMSFIKDVITDMITNK